MIIKQRDYKGTDYGEFEFIAKKMYSRAAIKKAHETSLTKRQAIVLTKSLSKKFFKDENTLVLKWITRGKWNLGGIDVVGNKKIPIVELHADKESKKHFGLRAGIVLHEFSHALANYHSRRVSRGEGHGREFIKTFNKVLRFYSNKLA